MAFNIATELKHDTAIAAAQPCLQKLSLICFRHGVTVSFLRYVYVYFGIPQT